MDYWRQAKDRIMQSVGLSEKIQPDHELDTNQQRLKRLILTVESMRLSMQEYAHSMLVVGQASRKLGDDISRFYQQSISHQTQVQTYIDAALDQDSNSLFLFKDQFTSDIDRLFDQWLSELHTLADSYKILQEQYIQTSTLHRKIQTALQSTKNTSSPDVALATYVSERDSRINGQQALEMDQKLFTALQQAYQSKKINAIKITTIRIEERYERFESYFVRLMELQKDFFQDGVDVMDKFSPFIATYRQKAKLPGHVPQNVPSVSTTTTNTKTPAPAANPKFDSKGFQTRTTGGSATNQSSPLASQPAVAPAASATSTSAPAAAPAPAVKPAAAPAPAPAATPQPQQPAQQQKPSQVNLFDLDFGASSPATSTPRQNQTTPMSTKAGGDVFDLFGTSSPTTPAASVAPSVAPAANKTQPKPSQQQQQSNPASDPFSLFTSTPSTPSNVSSHTDLGDFFSAGSSSAKPSASQSKSNTADGFDSLLTGFATKSTVGGGGVDDIDDDVSTPSSASVPPPTNNSFGFTSGPSSEFDFDPLGPAPTTSQAQTSSYQPDQDQPVGPEMTENEERAAINDMKSSLETRVEQWKYKQGVERDIQGLLANLHAVLWTGHSWKKIDTTQLLDYNSTKKVFRRALLTVHPDKVSTGTPEMKATAELIFETLNMAFKKYEIQQGLRSA